MLMIALGACIQIMLGFFLVISAQTTEPKSATYKSASAYSNQTIKIAKYTSQ